MPEELKIRLRDAAGMEKRLRVLGAEFAGELHAVDTCFEQPEGSVLKVTEDETGTFLVSLKAKDGKFEIVSYERAPRAKELAERFGVRCVLRKRRRFWRLGELRININRIEGVGDFLIVEGERLDKDRIVKRLRIEGPEFITESFDRLPKR